jgi:hypothetical protein
MLNQNSRLVAAILTALVCWAVFSGWDGRRIAAAANPSQDIDRRVYISPQTSMDPVSIEKITVGDHLIHAGVKAVGWRDEQSGTPFQANDDWLKDMSIVVKNRTDKVIVWAGITFYFPDTGDGHSTPVTMHSITLGQMPEIDSFSNRGQKYPPETDKQPLFLAPGQTLVIRVADHVDAMQSFVEERFAWSQVTRVWIAPFRFFFADGMRWDNLSGFGVPDPNHPGQFTNMDRGRYFPGNPSQNWPPADAPGTARF